MRTALARGLVIMCAAALAACGDDGGSPSINTSTDNLCDQVAQVACHDMYQCCAEGEIEDILGVTDPRTEDQCRDDLHTSCERGMAANRLSLQNKHITFDAKIMNACLEAIVAPSDTCTSIESIAPWTDACMDSAWVGAVAAGDACDFADECVKDSYCTSGRMCAALPVEGMACANLQTSQAPAACASGLYCDQTSVCHAKLADGAACNQLDACQKGSFCDTSATTPACTPLHAVGETCPAQGTCAEGATCLPGSCAGSDQSCFANSDCNRRCEGTTELCTVDSTCSTGTCSGSATACFSQAGCPVGSTCVFPVRCVAAACLGNVVCGEAHVTVDYCHAALGALPL